MKYQTLSITYASKTTHSIRKSTVQSQLQDYPYLSDPYCNFLGFFGEVSWVFYFPYFIFQKQTFSSALLSISTVFYMGVIFFSFFACAARACFLLFQMLFYAELFIIVQKQRSPNEPHITYIYISPCDNKNKSQANIS